MRWEKNVRFTQKRTFGGVSDMSTLGQKQTSFAKIGLLQGRSSKPITANPMVISSVHCGMRRVRMIPDYEISLATPSDISGMLALQEGNLPDKGGSLSVRLSEDWFKDAILEESAVVCRYDGKVVGYVMGTSLAANAHIAIIQAMLYAFPPPPDCYLYGPICVAESERGRGLARAMFEDLRARLVGRPAMLFVRADNAASIRAHHKMGMRDLGTFMNDGVSYIALTFTG
jgi:ribosomal protein S18 acetylase RimI-like enzyme